ncbi:AAA family ATPase [Silvanigrella aquatica]|uniref:Endonuclease GajA/Old nuclease/RecF-like AAA domain-containing protein n=1 Tax=Silvanigrella aquatica TaxID=1915309 RepID=A0A1L4D0M8_9BACT|nr:AAA family ATPase [Silvanigrella aquatica]APJ03730.1 hypothetical protein AXG55_07345 [Silvanigrella aquatica]
MILNKVIIRKYKQIKHTSLDISEINILIGANNSGKISILQALQFSIGCAKSIKLHALKLQSGSYTISIDELLYIPTSDIFSLGNGRILSENSNPINVKLFAV